MWQTQSVGTVRTAHISVLLTANIVSHNPAQSSSDNIPSWPPDDYHNSDVVQQMEGDQVGQRQMEEAKPKSLKSTNTGITYYGENANQKRYATVRQLQPDFVIVQIETDIEWLAFSGIGNKQRNCTTFSSRNGARTSRPWSDITRSSRPRLRKEIRSSSIWISSINPGQDLSLHHNIQLAINRPIWHSQL